MFAILHTYLMGGSGVEENRFDFTSPDRREQNIEMLLQMRTVLVERGIIKKKRIYLDENSLTSEEKKELEEMTSRLSDVEYAKSREDATHVIEADPEHLKA